jgi:hypothetical protein
MNAKPLSVLFQPQQIVYIALHPESNASRLYADMVQVVEPKQVCWVRPIAIAEEVVFESADARGGGFGSTTEYTQYYDLRQASDLLMPAALFRPALDTEAIPLMMAFYQYDHEQVVRTSSDCEQARRGELAQPSTSPSPQSSDRIYSEPYNAQCQRLNQCVQQICWAYPELF